MSTALADAFNELLLKRFTEAGLDKPDYVSYSGDTISLDGHFTARELQLVLSVLEEMNRRPAAVQERCDVCNGQGSVNTPWQSGYPHLFPCPKCQPNTPCTCGLATCPGPARIEEWKNVQSKA